MATYKKYTDENGNTIYEEIKEPEAPKNQKEDLQYIRERIKYEANINKEKEENNTKTTYIITEYFEMNKKKWILFLIICIISTIAGIAMSIHMHDIFYLILGLGFGIILLIKILWELFKNWINK